MGIYAAKQIACAKFIRMICDIFGFNEDYFTTRGHFPIKWEPIINKLHCPYCALPV